ncbi:hypothetical protein BBC27_00170 [Acidithiobacillus ferrivorans]|uniref:Uncharacterized protein n=1 Tax=Acidithiobacillus ferrivorans TaxID=160808 RepID=A0A1B9C256_9PROT|nr:hypothetical protein [Acidithiobacillus ferrivorans]OCB04004.1 hypothetical protein BBC27_00170 [Acidithiobacillus ferrivorans]
MSDHAGLLQMWLLPGVTVLLAIATGALACFTYKMAKSTEKALEQNARLVGETHDLVESNKVLVESEERHHQEGMSPFVAFEFYSEWSHINIDDLIDLSRIKEHIIYLKGSVSNKGYGLSNNGSLYLLCWDSDANTPCIKIDLPILAPGQVWNNKKINGVECIEMCFIEGQFEAAITEAVKNKGWLVVLVVEDIFKKKHVTHIKPNHQDSSVDVYFNRNAGDSCQAFCNCMR